MQREENLLLISEINKQYKCKDSEQIISQILQHIEKRDKRLKRLSEIATIKQFEGDINIDIDGLSISINELLDFCCELYELRMIEQQDF